MTKEALDLALEVLQINLKLLEKINPYKGQEDLLSDSLDLTHKAITAIKQARSAPVHSDSVRIDWLTNNPLEALDIFGHVKGADAVRWIRQEIDNAMLKKDGATHD
jgi:hypothetical protein